MADVAYTPPSEVVQHRRPVAPYIPASRAHATDAFTGYSEPVSEPSDQNARFDEHPDQAKQPVLIRGLYSATQFDTLSVLSRVYTRPNPKIELGPIDDSVSFVVVDAMQHDNPIVYCSQNFYKLTGYRPDEIVGRNCRFLQYPPEHPNATGIDRPIPSERNPAVEAFKKSLMTGQECQASLVNYRRDGEAFLNLISVVPVRWKDEATGKEKEYSVGFQVDLNEALGGLPDEPAVGAPPPPDLLNGSSTRSQRVEEARRGPGDESWAET